MPKPRPIWTDRFSTRLAFGHGGSARNPRRRPHRMNRVLVAQAAAVRRVPERACRLADPTVVVGHDGRRNSDVFARDSVEIFAGAGLKRRAAAAPAAHAGARVRPVRHLGADAGVMVTASHNPPDDNGYKVYLGGDDEGAQIVSPADAEIAAHIQRIADTGT